MCKEDWSRASGISKDTPVRIQVRTERVSCRWRAEKNRYRGRRGRNDLSYMWEATGRKLRPQGGTRNEGMSRRMSWLRKVLPSGL